MSETLLILVVALIVLYGFIRKVNVYDAFVHGAKDGLASAVGILPNLAAMIVAIALMRESGLLAGLQGLLTPLMRAINIPDEAAPLLLMRPFSGSGSLAILSDVMETAGPDSRAGLVASTLLGSSETIFYTMGIYMAAGNVAKSRYALGAALAAWIVSCCAAGLFYR